MNTDSSNVEDINIHQIIERLSMSCIASFGEQSNIFRNRSFTLFMIERDFKERFDSVTVSESISSSMSNLSFSGLPYLCFDISPDFTRDFCHGRQRVSPFYHDLLTTTTDRTTGLLQSDRLVFGTLEGASDRWWRHRIRSHQGSAARLRTPGCIRHKPL